MRLRLVIYCLLLSMPLMAQQDSIVERQSSGLRVSLLTCGPGFGEVWEVFGHAAIRVIDSTHGIDYVYNYGTFNFGPDFIPQFVRGKLLYYVNINTYQGFIQEYVYANRSVEEQVLNIGDNDKEEIYAYLNWNAREENKYYKYDFFFDNCATRLRDVFEESLGNSFEWGNALPDGQQMSYRDIMNQYFYSKHWERFGVNLLLGSPTDSIMTNRGIMYLPDYLRNALAGARVHGEKITSKTELVLKGGGMEPVGVNWPFILVIGLLSLTMLGLSIGSMSTLGNIMSFLLLFVSGALGCIMLLMWLATDHQACQYNYNILWALPTNLLLAFQTKRGKNKYAYLAIGLLIMSLLLHVVGIQKMALLEFSPLLLSLVFIYGSIIRKNRK
ncbi:MAG: DUF4105 domain-containing protein [Flavipsychrobacter sp.]